MCIILVKPANVPLRQDYLRNCYNANGNGCGFAAIIDNKISITKGILEFENFWNMINTAQTEHPQSPMLVHFRIATSGDIDDYNCHPFKIDEQHALVHNGVLYDFSSKTSQLSDTCLFVDNIIKPLFERDKGFYQTKVGRYLIEETIGKRNKIAILGEDAEFVIFNESAGEWVDGIWYSNKSYVTPPPPKEKRQKHQHQRNSNFQGRKKQSKPSAYRKAGGDHLLTAREINDLTHHYHCKLKVLVARKIVEAYPFDEVPEKGTPEYMKYWTERGIIVTCKD